MKTLKILKLFLILSIFNFTKNIYADSINFEEGTFQQVLDKAQKENKVIMVDFMTDWCKWCIELDNKVYSNSEVSNFANQYQINYKIDAEKGEGIELARKYNVKGYPTILFLDKNGNEIDRIVGYYFASEFFEMMKDYNMEINTLSYLEKKVSENPNDIEANFKLAKKYSSSGNTDKVNILLTKVIEKDPENYNGFTDDALFMVLVNKEDLEGIQNFMKKYPSTNVTKDAYISIAEIYANKNEHDSAKKYYYEALKIFGKNDEQVSLSYANYLISQASQIIQKEQSSEEDLQKGFLIISEVMNYVNGSVNEASANYILSELHFRAKNYESALKAIDHSLAIFNRKLYRDQREKIFSAKR